MPSNSQNPSWTELEETLCEIEDRISNPTRGPLYLVLAWEDAPRYIYEQMKAKDEEPMEPRTVRACQQHFYQQKHKLSSIFINDFATRNYIPPSRSNKAFPIRIYIDVMD